MGGVSAVQIIGLAAAQKGEISGQLFERDARQIVPISEDADDTVMPRPEITDGGSRMNTREVFIAQTGEIMNWAAVRFEKDRTEGPCLPGVLKIGLNSSLAMQLFPRDRLHAAVFIENTEVITADAGVQHVTISHGIDTLNGIGVAVDRKCRTGLPRGSSNIGVGSSRVLRVVSVPGFQVVYIGKIDLGIDIGTAEMLIRPGMGLGQNESIAAAVVLGNPD